MLIWLGAITPTLREKTEKDSELANLTAELVKVDKGKFRFVIRNEGPADASNVMFEIDPQNSDNPLVKGDYDRKLPYPKLQSGQYFTLIAALTLKSTLPYIVKLSWENPDGNKKEETLHLSV